MNTQTILISNLLWQEVKTVSDELKSILKISVSKTENGYSVELFNAEGEMVVSSHERLSLHCIYFHFEDDNVWLEFNRPVTD